MARRSSARIRARNSSTPERVNGPNGQSQLRTPKTAPPLASVAEQEEAMPGAFPETDSPANDTPTKLANHIAVALAGKQHTPQNKKPRASMQEMHPEKFHASTTKPLEEARWLGMSAMNPQTEPPKGVSKWAPEAHTPTKSTCDSGAYEFTFRAQSMELSNEAQRMMAEKREEAARIKQQMVKIAEEDEKVESALGRKIAKPKAKSGRFSGVHSVEFQKMGSIATHAAASRPNSRDHMEGVSQLTRVPSKTGLSKSQLNSTQKQVTAQQVNAAGTQQSPLKHARNSSEDAPESPAKRIRLASPKSPSPAKTSVVKVATPGYQSGLAQPAEPKHGYSRLATPTKSSIARSATVKVKKTTMIPSLVRTPSKSASKASTTRAQAGDSLLLARSPTKIAHMSAKKETARQEVASPLLARSPSKALFPERANVQSQTVDSANDGGHPALLARSPSRPAREHIESANPEYNPKTPLLSRSPSKAPADANPFASLTTTTTPSTSLMNRFKLLRKSPIKSILRSPQRLYSDDPEKIANGTHLATPPANKRQQGPFTPVRGRVNDFVAATEPIVKHVDFTASTKSDDDSPLPAKANIIEPESFKTSMYPSLPQYPSLPGHSPFNNDKTARRQTLGPLTSIATSARDFTFRAGSNAAITFGPSLPAAKSSRPSIRHVSAEPEAASSQLSRKRKFAEDEEDDVCAPNAYDDEDMEGVLGGSDKENDSNTANIAAGLEAQRDEEQRPSKKVKINNLAGNLSRTSEKASGKGTSDDGQKAKVPSWAQGTAAQKARANLAKIQSQKKKAIVVQGKVKARIAAANGGTSGVGVKTAASDGRSGAAGRAGSVSVDEGEAKEKVVLSRARLDALSQPKRRVGA